MLQLGISERLSSLIQAIAVILIALIIGCLYSWELTLVTATGLMAIIAWYTITTPLIMQRYAAIQELEREAAGAATEALSSVRMIAAYGAEDKISAIYNKLVDKMSTRSKELSLIFASQHSPGT
jgi:ABC-type bacteriocin/lantibiotic exporter with double-glycine peptidase domain